MSAVYRFDGTLIHNIAHHNWTVEGIKALSRVYPRSPSRDTQIAAAILDRKVVHVPDSEAPGIPEPACIGLSKLTCGAHVEGWQFSGGNSRCALGRTFAD